MSAPKIPKYLQNKRLQVLIESILKTPEGEIRHTSHGEANSLNKHVINYLNYITGNHLSLDVRICQNANYLAPTHKKPLRIRKAVQLVIENKNVERIINEYRLMKL